jgi:hypothetical protein
MIPKERYRGKNLRADTTLWLTRSAFHDLDLLARQAVQLIHKLIDLTIRPR